MRTWLTGLLALTLASVANAAPLVLDPGPGTDYLGVWCGGQSVNEYAQGFDANGRAVATVRVTTSCHGSGRGSLNHYYMACWATTFFPNGAILSRSLINSGDWLQGHPAVSCNASLDPAAVFVSRGSNGEVLATLGTALIGTVNRAILDTLVPLETDPPTIVIDAPGDGAIYTLDEDVVASYACSDPSGVFSCSAPVADGGPLDTSLLGSGVFTVSARDALGNAGALTHSYRVATECSNGIDDDGDGAIDFDGGASANQGVAIAPADEDCDGSGATLSESASPDPESPPPPCGLGSELGVVLPVLLWLRARRRRAAA